MMDDGPPGMSVDTARAIVAEHVNQACGNCRGARCWMLEWALKVVLDGGPEGRRDLLAPITAAARRIAGVHAPGTDNLCAACGRPGCEPYRVAAGWIEVVKPLPPEPPTADEIRDARLVVKAHQGYGCPDCRPDHCDTEEWAVLLLFKLATATLPPGPLSEVDAERIAREIAGGPVERISISMVVHKVKAGEKTTACGKSLAKVRQSPTESTTTSPAGVTCPMCRR